MSRSPLSTTLENFEVWFVTGSQNLYGEETLRQVAEQSQAVAAGLEGLPVRVVWKPVLKDSEAIRRLALEVNARDDVIGVVAWMHTFSPAKMWIAGLDALQKPLLHLHTQANVELPWAEIDFDFMNLNQAAHGDREFGYIQTRLGVARKTVVGHVSNPAVKRQVEDWQRAAAGWAASRTLKLARFGDNMRYVAVTEGDKTEAELRFGVQVNTWGVNELADAVAAASAADIDALVQVYLDEYDVASELVPAGNDTSPPGRCRDRDRAAVLPRGGRVRRVHDELRRPRRPHAAAGARRAAPHGRRVRVRRGGGLEDRDPRPDRQCDGCGAPGGASLMEDYTYDLVPGQERILGAHMLEVSPSLTTARPRLEVHPLGIGGKDDPVRLVFTADPGPALVVAMSDMRDRFRLVANVVENVEAPDLPQLPVGRAIWKPQPDFATSAACWLTAGAAHHTVMTTAVGIEVFRDFADIARTELVVIDENTTVRGFQNELRWNQAYYRLAQGF